jgi:coenzyme F420-reducing hydrogenase alpha subunit
MDGRSYMVGPLARLHLNYDRLSAVTRDVLADAGIRLPLRNPYQTVIARAAEMLHAADEALRVVDTYEPPPAPSLAFTMKSGTGTAATEAPRGLLYHRYAIDEDGTIRTVVIVPPTSQNQRRMEDDLRAVLPGVLDLDNEAAARACERVIRCYDPCISCATHFLRLEVTHA